MNKSRERNRVFHLILSSLIALLIVVSVVAEEDDFKCLQGLKDALSDPQEKLSSWSFANTSIGYICRFVGVSCWNEKENRLIGLQLPSMKLQGKIPESLRYCQSLQMLELSDNAISGTIPSQICEWLPYLVHLDLSRNDLSGSIPPELVNCKYLNTLILKDNRLSGSIPYQLSRLGRLKKLSVANNDLSGQIPSSFSDFDSTDFDGNSGLCGQPLGFNCGGLKKRNLVIVISAAVFGAVVSLLLGFGLWWLFIRSSSRRRHKKGVGIGKDDGTGSSSWTEKFRAHKLDQVCLFQKPLVKIKLADLMVATNNFDPQNTIISTRTGTSYKAILPDGSSLALKRLHNCKLSEKQFRSEMNRLGQLRHPNLVPLLGFCVVENEKVLVYKHMSNGSLFTKLHGSGNLDSQHGRMDWATRLKIGIGAARGLAWLHHGCQEPFLHQNISCNVILLDEDLDARITDFGLAKLLSSPDSRDSTFNHGDFGEFGYVAPEYSSTMVASLKGDVFAFGVVLLELVTGQKPLEISNADEGFKGNLVDWVNQLSSSGRIKDAIDKSLCGRRHDDEILKFLRVACTCVASRPKDRSSMYQVYQTLRTISENYDFSEQFDEFPLIFGKQQANHQE
ncbi:Protein kinase domain [Macleaya cordata]|uniref:Protein kinase domain n=1 Tax=Macleaya cordata TaxID=56857 RepID=A0A200QFE7_MACCD|nr:Protein kinase domain [Macleaya cordata]